MCAWEDEENEEEDNDEEDNDEDDENEDDEDDFEDERDGWGSSDSEEERTSESSRARLAAEAAIERRRTRDG